MVQVGGVYQPDLFGGFLTLFTPLLVIQCLGLELFQKKLKVVRVRPYVWRLIPPGSPRGVQVHPPHTQSNITSDY